MNICIFGDSITWGAYDPKNGGWANRLRNYFELQNREIDVYNLGVSGDSTTDLLDRIEVETKSRQANVIIFAIGINDAQFISSTNSSRMSDADFKSNIGKLYEKARLFTPNVIFIGLTSVDESKTNPWSADISYTNEDIRRFDQIIENFCSDNSLLDLHKIPASPNTPSPSITCFSSFDEPIGSPLSDKTASGSVLDVSGRCEVLYKSSLQFIPVNDLLNNDDLIDGLHPNVRGHNKIFKRVKLIRL